MNRSKCVICLNESLILVNTYETDSNNIKWSCKLSSCVPEVEWNEEYRICTMCIVKLEAACAFRNLCLQSTALKKQLTLYLKGKKEELSFANIKPNSLDGIDPSSKETFKYVCFHCNKVLLKKVLLIRHIRTKHGPQMLQKIKKKYKCDKSYNSCSIKDNLNNQLKHKLEIPKTEQGKTKVKRGRKKLEEKTTVCQICGMTFNTQYLAKRHMRNVHATEKNYQCDICERKFASPVYLSAHKRYHSGERPHICSFCGKGFITGSDLYHHEKIHANKREYKCDKCPKAFNTSSDLHKHKLCVHQDRSEWKYVCTFCDRQFPLKTNLDAHTKTHTGERNFACHLCERRCVNKSVLLRHIRSHSNVRLFKCTLCNMDYKYQKSLDIHMTKAHGIGDAKIPEKVKKFFCHICPKSYFANNKLQKHIRTHTGERPFSCQICQKRFIDKSYVKQHLRTAHNVTFSDINFDY